MPSSEGRLGSSVGNLPGWHGLWTEGVPPSRRAEGAHAAEPDKATATRAPDSANKSACRRYGRQDAFPPEGRLGSSIGNLPGRHGLWSEGVPPSRRAEGTHAAEPDKATATRAPDSANKAPVGAMEGRMPSLRRAVLVQALATCQVGTASGRRASRPPGVPKARTQRSRPRPPQHCVPDNAKARASNRRRLLSPPGRTGWAGWVLRQAEFAPFHAQSV